MSKVSGVTVPKLFPNTMMGTLFLLHLAAKGGHLSTLAQDLAEICYKKLEIGNFSAADVGKWWKNLGISRILPIFAASEGGSDCLD